jgi:hypothetical protein
MYDEIKQLTKWYSYEKIIAHTPFFPRQRSLKIWGSLIFRGGKNEKVFINNVCSGPGFGCGPGLCTGISD